MVLSTLGCESTTPDEDTALVTDGTSFQLDSATDARGHLWYGGQVPYRFTNRTGSKVYGFSCGFVPSLEMETASEWVGIWGGTISVGCTGPPIVIQPRQVYKTTLHVWGCRESSGEGPSCSPGLRPPPSASTPIRIVWRFATSSYDRRSGRLGEVIPLEERVSNSFTFEMVPR